MKKRVIAFITLALVLLSSFAGYAFEDVQNTNVREAVEKLVSLKILNGYEDGSFRPDNNITRAEFITIVTRVLGVASVLNGVPESMPFTDVSNTHWAAMNIKYGVDNGLISGYGNGLFGPEDNVTYEQALKIIYNAMGYEKVSKDLGGYPDGYLSLCAKHGLVKGNQVTFTDNATRGNIAYILEKAMDVEILEQEINDKKDVYVKTGETLLSKLLKINSSQIRRGYVVACRYINIENDIELDEKQLMIKDENGECAIYDTENIDCKEFLGCYVEFYVNESKENPRNIIYEINPIKNKILEIPSEIISGVNNKSDIEIITEEDQREKKISVPSSIKTVYNNRFTETNYKDFDIKNGYIKLIDNNNDNKYEVAFIFEHFSFLVDKISAYADTMFIKDATYKGLTRINLDTKDNDFYYSVSNSDGEKLELSDLKEDDVVSVIGDKNSRNIEIKVSNKTIIGTAERFDEDYVWISGEKYSIGVLDNGKNIIDINLGREGKYYIDYFGAVVGFKESESTLKNSGYVVKTAYTNENTPNKQFAFKIINGGNAKKETDKNDKPYYTVGNSDYISVKCESVVLVDGVKKSSDELGTLIHPGDYILYDKNEKGNIVKIEVVANDIISAKRAFNAEIAAFGGAFYIDKDTTVVCVPEEEVSVDDDYFTKVYLDASKKYLVSAYDVDAKTKIAKYAVVTTGMKSDIGGTITGDSEIFIVTKSSEIYENEETFFRLEGYQHGETVKLTVKSDARVYTQAKSLTSGDIIYYSLNSQGVIDNIEKVEDIYPVPGFFHKDSRGENERVFGKLYEITRDELSETSNTQRSELVINIAESEDSTPERITMSYDTKDEIPVYIMDKATGKIQITDIYELYSTREVGYSKASDVFVCKRRYKVNGIIAIK